MKLSLDSIKYNKSKCSLFRTKVNKLSYLDQDSMISLSFEDLEKTTINEAPAMMIKYKGNSPEFCLTQNSIVKRTRSTEMIKNKTQSSSKAKPGIVTRKNKSMYSKPLGENLRGKFEKKSLIQNVFKCFEKLMCGKIGF